MNQNNQKIDHLKKVSVCLKAAAPEDATEFGPAGHGFEFIYGLGIDGLTPFEFELAGKSAGDEIEFRVKREKLGETFGHITPSFPSLPEKAPELYIRAKIDKVAQAENSEVVRFLAKATSCGCDCDCCGDHC